MDKFTEVLMIVVAFSIVVFAIFLPKIAIQKPGIYGSSGSPTNSNTSNAGVNSNILLSLGNASSVSDPNSEYITLSNTGLVPIDITGWILENGSNTAIIPKGTQKYSSNFNLSDIVLAPGEQAVVVSGASSSVNGQTLPSFKTNICTSYLENSNQFPAGLGQSCPWPGSETGLDKLDNNCRDFVKSLSGCKVPHLSADNSEALSTSCRAFIAAHLNYNGCLLNHENDANFSGTTWYVYLHKSFEMWPSSYGNVILYDGSGNLITNQKY